MASSSTSWNRTGAASWADVPLLTSATETRRALQRLSDDPLSEEFVSQLLDGKLPPTDHGAGAALLMKLLLNYRLPPEQFINYRGAYQEPANRPYATPEHIPILKLRAPVVSDAFLDSVFARMRDVELTNRTLGEIDKESQLVHWMSAVTIEVARYFEGAMRNEAERSLRGEISRGQVEFVWVAFRMCVVVVMEMKKKGFETSNHAQLMGELEAAAFSNVINRTSVDTVLGLMANKDGWIFMSYDTRANTFKMSETLLVDKRDPQNKVRNRAFAIRLMWSMFLDGYCNAVTAMQKRSLATCLQLEGDLENPAVLLQESKRRKFEEDSDAKRKSDLAERRASADKWHNVAMLAFQSKQCALSATNADGFENALRLLHESISKIPEFYVKPIDIHEQWTAHQAGASSIPFEL
ncbi:hypothetical protein HDU87_004055 [Geranomyces variabilis]|uniref:Uncharacterized protein n=1 Tax=Geranomyces variabilis TaxID=109894 RepID=A0AAD5TR18_9FUNG|nr:hypothetical protein HDU87_004055 [Geranomyces variabilis]